MTGGYVWQCAVCVEQISGKHVVDTDGRHMHFACAKRIHATDLRTEDPRNLDTSTA